MDERVCVLVHSSLLLWRQKKRVEIGAVACAIADNSSGVVDTVGDVKLPSRIRRNQIVQIKNLSAVVNEGVIDTAFGCALADYDPRVVDCENPSLLIQQSRPDP